MKKANYKIVGLDEHDSTDFDPVQSGVYLVTSANKKFNLSKVTNINVYNVPYHLDLTSNNNSKTILLEHVEGKSVTKRFPIRAANKVTPVTEIVGFTGEVSVDKSGSTKKTELVLTYENPVEGDTTEYTSDVAIDMNTKHKDDIKVICRQKLIPFSVSSNSISITTNYGEFKTYTLTTSRVDDVRCDRVIPGLTITKNFSSETGTGSFVFKFGNNIELGMTAGGNIEVLWKNTVVKTIPISLKQNPLQLTVNPGSMSMSHGYGGSSSNTITVTRVDGYTYRGSIPNFSLSATWDQATCSGRITGAYSYNHANGSNYSGSLDLKWKEEVVKTISISCSSQPNVVYNNIGPFNYGHWDTSARITVPYNSVNTFSVSNSCGTAITGGTVQWINNGSNVSWYNYGYGLTSLGNGRFQFKFPPAGLGVTDALIYWNDRYCTFSGRKTLYLD